MSSNETNTFSNSLKVPIFDGKDKSKFQEWADDMYATLQYYDLEEYVEVEWKDKPIPAKSVTDVKQLLQRKEMKKAMAIFVRATKELPNMIVKECETPYKIYEKLKEKYSVKKCREDFDVLDQEWNQFKVTDIGTDPDLIYKTLEEQSRKLKVFGERYSKDSLQMLSKLKYALPKEYDHVFTYLNTNEERGKTFDEQLETAKAMISSHYKTKIESNDGLENSMLCMMTSDNGGKKDAIFCSECKKKGHPAYKDGKPFCYVLKDRLKHKKDNKTASTTKTSESNFKGKCFKCKERGHMKKDCPKNTNNDEQDLNSLFINCAFTNKKQNLSRYQGKDLEFLADTGAQCHVLDACEDDKGSTVLSVKVGNKSTMNVIRKEDITIENKCGVTLDLNNTRIVKGMATNIVSILQLVEEGWDVSVDVLNSKKVIKVRKGNKMLVFHEKNKKNLCFLTAEIVKSDFVANINLGGTMNYNEFHGKMGHFGDEKTRVLAKKHDIKLVGNIRNCQACNTVTAKAKPIPKATKTTIVKVGEKMDLIY